MSRDDLDRLLQFPHPAGAGFVRRMAGFLRALRENGFAVGLGEGRDALRIAAAVDLSQPAELRRALKPLLAARREEAERFEDVFDAYWLRRHLKTGFRSVPVSANTEPMPRRLTLGPMPESEVALADTVTRASGEESEAPESSALRRGGAAHAESLKRTDFRHLDKPDDLQLLNQMIESFALSLRRQRQRRRKAARRGERLDLRRMLHASIPHGGEPIEVYRRRARRHPLRPVLLLDASGSMSQYSAIFLRFMLALLKRLPDGEGYLFHTRLVEIGPVLREQRRIAALERLSLMAQGWGGGTRIGECLSTFDRHHASRVLRGRSILFILSDGYDTGDPAVLAKAMAALSKRARRIVWLNPLLGWPGYQPVAGGMAAALPYVDMFAPAHNLESLAALAPQLARA
jgi:uncharacterized protein with von Willebrand factor type A (vWA) domain